jgi:hypothetical protein
LVGPCESLLEGATLPETSCRFCGVSGHLPHETQEACIAALQEELTRLREIMQRLKSALGETVSGNDPNREAVTASRE